MKSTTLIVLSIFSVLLASLIVAASRPRGANANATAPPSSYTGAPGELGTCANCHVGIYGTGSIGLATTGSPFGYFPGETDTLFISIQDHSPTVNRWGFEATVLKNSDLTMAGTLTPVALTGNRVGTAVSGGRTYISQRSNGATAPLDPNDGTYWGKPNIAGWEFEWTAPPLGSGGVTIYFSGVAANGDQQATAADYTYGGAIYLNELTPTPVSTTTWGKIKKKYQ
jgi:hypothetical protein